MNKKNIFLFLSVLIFLSQFEPALAGQKAKKISNFTPPFEMHGVVKEIKQDALQVYIPHIDKQITVIVSPGTLILNRLNSFGANKLDEIKVEDLVVIEGVLKEERFLCSKISYLSMEQK